ncbi:hypothetical protein [Rhodanobacter sp. DHB23]|uniref:hypothetical protein n=1 Tax=Rhodanobacter sp. DHB23 TaxID=2775923 RepID=UPI00178364AD|nr:hypothetical protein [Rhodanobacter sp. DHB23]MBD8872823.1 hypothetical protein [Rhodanobacter sp. DHB23]
MDGFTHFLAQCKTPLVRLARATRGEHSYADVCQQAWLEAHELAAAQGQPPDFLDPVFQQQTIHRLYRRLFHPGRWFRATARLDHGFDGDDGPHPLARRLVSDEGRNPLSTLLEQAAATEPQDEDRLPLSLALAWVMLLRRHDRRMCTVAARLLVSVSHAYRCCARAKWLATCQLPIPWRREPVDTSPQLGPWRRRRTERIPQQLAFDFNERLELPHSSDAG